MHRNIRLLSWFNFFTDFVFFAPVAIIYFAQVTGSYALGMSVFSVAYVSSAVFEVPTGVISDMVGRKKTMVLGAIASVLCVILYAMAQTYWALILGSVFQGISRAFYSGNNDALLHDTLKESGKENEYHDYLGKASGMFQIALAVATGIGGIMASVSFPLVMWASVIPQIIALVIALQITEPTIYTEKVTNVFFHLRASLSQFRKNYKLQLLTASSILRFGIGESTFFLRSVFISSLWPLWAIGISYSLSHVGGALGFHFSGRIINRFSHLKVLNFEILFNRIVNLIALIFPTILSPALMTTSSLTYGAGSVAINSLLQKEFTQAQRATMSSIASLGGSILFGIFSVLLGFVADRFDARAAMIMAHILLLLPLIFYRMIFTHDKKGGTGK
ncbi:MFS transporter [Candidatus Gottesmanbacteria bacterium]|nr:MFS transporter [Candidatus Gottesmanbacteria bacterium]